MEPTNPLGQCWEATSGDPTPDPHGVPQGESKMQEGVGVAPNKGKGRENQNTPYQVVPQVLYTT